MKVLFFVNADWVLSQHRMALLLALVQQNHEVVVFGNDTGQSDTYTNEGIKFINWNVSRSGTSLWTELKALYEAYQIIRKIRPDILHAVTIKAVIYAGLVSLIVNIPMVVNSISGMGYVFTDERKILLRYIVKKLYSLILKRKAHKTIFENPDDRDYFRENRMIGVSDGIHIKSGVGVDCKKYKYQMADENEFIVMLPGRMLWHKGVGEFISASRALNDGYGDKIRFVLVGPIDDSNPAGIKEADLQKWVSEGVVEYWGKKSNMPDIYALASVVVLPSYREGMPTALMEAAAVGRPIITTDVPGCREVVVNGDNGLLVPPKDADALACAIEKLYLNKDMRNRMGKKSREMAETIFNVENTVRETIALYNI